MAYAGKYGNVTTEHGLIPGDEPVVIFRAQDRLTGLVLEYYRLLCYDAECDATHMQGIADAQVRFREWQARNYTKTPGPNGERTRPEAGS